LTIPEQRIDRKFRRKRTTWYENQKKRKMLPFFRLVDHSFRFQLLLASTIALLVLGALNRAETCRANHYSSSCLCLDRGSVFSVNNIEAFSIVTAALLYLLEAGQR
jgi:hypothetical protein